jgi:hypothetical protein
MKRINLILVSLLLLSPVAVHAADPRDTPGNLRIDQDRLDRLKAAKMPKFDHPLPFNTPEADAILAALEVFPPDNPWNIPVDAWPVAANSPAMIAAIGGNKPLRYNPDMGFVLVPPGQKKVDVKLSPYAGESDPGPYPVPDNTVIEGWPADFKRGDAARKALTLAEAIAAAAPPRKPGAIECETMKVLAKSGDFFVGEQDMDPFGGERWSNGRHLLGKATAVRDFVEIEWPAPNAVPRLLVLYATQASDYATLRFRVHGQEVAATFDGYAAAVQPAPAFPLGLFTPRAGKFTLYVEVAGANPAAKGAKYFFGLDCVTVENP